MAVIHQGNPRKLRLPTAITTAGKPAKFFMDMILYDFLEIPVRAALVAAHQ
jgi:hypothetical protein